MSDLSSSLNDPAYWRQRAEETRALADQLADPVDKKILLDAALTYEKLATEAAVRPLAVAPRQK